MNRSGPARLAAVLLAVGVVVMVAGTFAPWLRSGQVTRNSYRTAGLAQRLLDLRGVAAAALDAMPLLALLCAVGGLLFGFGYRRTALALLTVLALLLAALSVAVLAAPASSEIAVTVSGPAITLGGALLALIAAITSVLVHRADSADSADRSARQLPSYKVE
jgi:hypothetical protein